MLVTVIAELRAVGRREVELGYPLFEVHVPLDQCRPGEFASQLRRVSLVP